ncbi:putative glucan endo-1,3-beta-glucosidase A6 [Cardamine amara subsp. amara]|uniref:Glucan endo-1,3-beta-glucosidase A6 n=1 Tax=Cardamine amara subsp. amara TaxID=228776 RepID=A0ABD1BM82_CARAN
MKLFGVFNMCGAALAPGRKCYEPVSIYWHASYAISSYWAQGCYLNGLAHETTINPGNARCKFPSVAL